MTKDLPRCPWPGEDPLYVAYHDDEWGVPEYDDRALYEKLVLDGFQAGLSWITILRKRDNFRKAFDGFEPAKIARYTPRRVEKLMLDAGIVRNRLKLDSTVSNARAFIDVQKQYGSFDEYIWRFVDGRPKRNARKGMGDIPSSTPESDAMSKDLKKRGFRFVGTTICYAFMQATGMVNDHLVSCFRYKELSA